MLRPPLGSPQYTGQPVIAVAWNRAALVLKEGDPWFESKYRQIEVVVFSLFVFLDLSLRSQYTFRPVTWGPSLQVISRFCLVESV